MTYLEQSLLADESILYTTHRHWIIFWPVAMWLGLAFLFYTYVPEHLLGVIPFSQQYFISDLVSSFALIAAIIAAITSYLNYQTSEFGITSKRVLLKIGIIRRYSLEIFLKRVESINVNQSILGRIFDYGTIYVIGTGGTWDYFRFIAEPMTFRHNVQKQISYLYDETGETN